MHLAPGSWCASARTAGAGTVWPVALRCPASHHVPYTRRPLLGPHVTREIRNPCGPPPGLFKHAASCAGLRTIACCPLPSMMEISEGQC